MKNIELISSYSEAVDVLEKTIVAYKMEKESVALLKKAYEKGEIDNIEEKIEEKYLKLNTIEKIIDSLKLKIEKLKNN
ncbi:MAG: hypothetical protein WCR30_03205 [Clostridia bacterium]